MSIAIDKTDWAILESLADDYETLDQIVPSVQAIEPTAAERLIAEKVGRLLVLGLIRIMGKHDGWYGMTSQGWNVWEEHSQKFSNDRPNWSTSWTVDVDYKTGRGFAVGASREVCELAIAKHSGLDIVIDPLSFEHRAVESFNAKYYKRINGGHRIDFAFTKKAA